MDIHENHTVFLADDHRMFLDGLKLLISRVEGIEVIGEAMDGAAAWAGINQQQPSLLITDISMPGISGIALTRKVKEDFPNTRILVLTMYDDYSLIREIMDAGAEGYILKQTGRHELIRAVKNILGNGTWYSQQVLATLSAGADPVNANDRLEELSERETEVLKLILKEHSSKEIADLLNISKRTVDTHRIRILEKTGCKTLIGLIKMALSHRKFRLEL